LLYLVCQMENLPSAANKIGSMYKLFALILSFTLVNMSVNAQRLTLRKQTRIHHSVTVRKAVYFLEGNSLEQPVIIISGTNIVVDFNGAVLVGSPSRIRPDAFLGLAIHIAGGKNITIRNLTAKGYKVAIRADSTYGLKLENCDLSYNYRQHLNSSQQKEDISDWLSYHHNEQDQWLRYGAGIYLKNCEGATIRQCRVSNGQNGLLMRNCDSCLIYNNDLSFNSGVGLGMYHCNGNKVLYNKINFNVRGYSDGVYNRGQDSGGILVYEQSSNNLFYKNAVTHSGDGFFLWAGQTTMDTGTGGCNDNVIMDNDFSYAPTNGVEVTFSRNRIIHNRIFECDNGIWAGYSYNTGIEDNQFRTNHTAIAIEHGQDNTINNNLFFQDRTAIKLWANKEDTSWGYPKFRDTRSRNYAIVSNSFNKNQTVYSIRNTDSLKIFDNRISLCPDVFDLDSNVRYLDSIPDPGLLEHFAQEVQAPIPEIKDPADPFKGLGKWAGRQQIWITEWGPYNFQYPIIWNTHPTDSSSKMHFEVKGPAKGKWKIIALKGLESLSRTTDTFPASFTASKIPGAEDQELIASYTGPVFTDAWGNKAGGPHKPVLFHFRAFFQPVSFQVSWYPFDAAHNPIADTSQMQKILSHPPVKTENTSRLDYAWWYGLKAGSQSYNQFLTVAEGESTFRPGDYDFSLTWDDAVRLYIDGRLILNEWDPSKYNFDNDTPNRHVRLNLSGTHKIRVEHVNLGGFATLHLNIQPAP
jgi:parallel beta-helix repeat protein